MASEYHHPQASPSTATTTPTTLASNHHGNGQPGSGQQQQVTTPSTARTVMDRQTEAMLNLKIRRILNLNSRLRDELAKERVPASQTCLS